MHEPGFISTRLAISPQGFGAGSEFGFKNPLNFFDLLPPIQQTAPTRFGIRSVSVSPGDIARKTRYDSSAYHLVSALSLLLIIGRPKVQVLLGTPFSIIFNDL